MTAALGDPLLLFPIRPGAVPSRFAGTVWRRVTPRSPIDIAMISVQFSCIPCVVPILGGEGEVQQPDQQAEQRRVVGRPFPPGVSGNPEGKSKAARRARQDAIIARWAEPFGGTAALKPVEIDLLRQAADLTMSRPTRTEDRVRVSNAVSKILAQVGFCDKRRRREPAPSPTLRQYLATKQGTPSER
jgi:hypothetical protein